MILFIWQVAPKAIINNLKGLPGSLEISRFLMNQAAPKELKKNLSTHLWNESFLFQRQNFPLKYEIPSSLFSQVYALGRSQISYFQAMFFNL